jgi:site-specific recombinase XerD
MRRARRAVTFEQFWLIFQKHHRVEPNTMQNYFSTWINHIRPYLRTVHVATFDPTSATRYFTALTEDGVTVTVRKRCRSVISAMIGLAVKMGYRADNPVQGLNVGKQAANKSIKVINETVFWALCGKLPLETQRLFAEFIVSTGVRFCEAISFQEGDLDYGTGMLTVCRSTVEVARQFHRPAAASSLGRTPRTASTGVSRSASRWWRKSAITSLSMGWKPAI